MRSSLLGTVRSAAYRMGPRAVLSGKQQERLVPELLCRALPGELWGAYNVLSGVARSYASKTPSIQPQATSTSEAEPDALKASSQIAADFPLEEETGKTPEGKVHAESLRQRLDFRPKLSARDVALCALIPAAICASFYFGVRPAKLTWLYALGLSMIYAAWVAICRVLLLERQYTARLVNARDLADSDSKFAKVKNLEVHYKAHGDRSNAKAAIHCYHGFGANTGSWDPVHQRMASQMNAFVTTHDMPGFGLTERPDDMSAYSLAFNGRLGRELLDLELNASQGKEDLELGGGLGTKQASNGDQSPPQVLVGHSLGAACATAEALNHPKGIKALILVAPAVIAFGFAMPQAAGKPGSVSTNGQNCQAAFGPTSPSNIASKKRQKNLPSRLAIALAQAFLSLTSGIWTRLLEPVTVVSLRSAVRSRNFWERGLRRAWHDGSGVKPHIVDAYRRPQLVRGWEKGLVRFTAARMAGGRSISKILKDAWKGEVKPTQAEDLAELVAKHGIKVLLIHGDKDGLVPLRNSVRLAKLLHGAELKVMQNTGHVPHEERPDEFLSLVDNFLSKI